MDTKVHRQHSGSLGLNGHRDREEHRLEKEPTYRGAGLPPARTAAPLHERIGGAWKCVDCGGEGECTCIEVVAIDRPTTQRYRICRETLTRAGIKTECLGLTLHARDAATAIATAKRLGLLAGLGMIVAIAEAA